MDGQGASGDLSTQNSNNDGMTMAETLRDDSPSAPFVSVDGRSVSVGRTHDRQTNDDVTIPTDATTYRARKTKLASKRTDGNIEDLPISGDRGDVGELKLKLFTE